MHWSNGKFHKDIIVGEKVFITDHKHVAISGNDTSITFGDLNNGIFTKLYGNNVQIDAKEYVDLRGNKGITISNISYGTTLPEENNVEGRVFFRLIS